MGISFWNRSWSNSTRRVARRCGLRHTGTVGSLHSGSRPLDAEPQQRENNLQTHLESRRRGPGLPLRIASAGLKTLELQVNTCEQIRFAPKRCHQPPCESMPNRSFGHPIQTRANQLPPLHHLRLLKCRGRGQFAQQRSHEFLDCDLVCRS